MPPSFVFGGDPESYTELKGVTYSGQPVYAGSERSLYLYRERKVWIVGKCPNDSCKGWQPVWSCAGDPRQKGNHTWKNLADGKTGEYTTQVLQATGVSTASSAVGVSNTSQQELAVPVMTDRLRQCQLRFHPSCKDGEVELTNDRCEAWVRESCKSYHCR